MRRPQEYRVEISTAAWNQLGVVPALMFREIKSQLDVVAEQGESLPPAPLPSEVHRTPPPGTLSLAVGDYVALYTVDHVNKVVLLLEVARRLPR